MSSYGAASTAAPSADAVPVAFDTRSDTVTKPTPGMLQAMLNAAVGDDVYDEDPSIHKLEAFVAQLTGKEAALFCATGTMTNQLAIRSQIGALESLICDIRAHIFRYECGGVAYHSQAHIIPLQPPNGGNITLEMIEAQVLTFNVHHAVTKLIEIENTLGGAVFPYDEIVRISTYAKQHGIKMHLDGARIWNASIATGIPLKQYCDHFDSVSLCLSKGLGAPIGSVLVGSRELIHRARHFRKLFGGGWRQAGLLAAGGQYAIEHQWTRMADDHANAKQFAELITKAGHMTVTNKVETNMVFVLLNPELRKKGVSWNKIAARLRSVHGIVVNEDGAHPAPVRFVFHLHITSEATAKLAAAINDEIAQALSAVVA
ncbi:threonine aldolase [Capsaspora owczarzaki ATCC 30864]|uniref:Threonine aldolase n=2 Tax=Capsaspora owczarzaki (strain ATCC 30864) TaxID=595528 RepID=A0A0D2X204_CAPO3|nr:threonine aldolase [Capsaspora owczarzaki ATCC 30864]